MFRFMPAAHAVAQGGFCKQTWTSGGRSSAIRRSSFRLWSGQIGSLRNKSAVHPAMSGNGRGGRARSAHLFDRKYRNDHSISCPGDRLWPDQPQIEIPAEGRTWRPRYVSYPLVPDYRALLAGLISEIGNVHVHMTLFLDNRARGHRIGPWRLRYPRDLSPEERTISSCRPHFFYTGRHPDSLHLP